MSIEMDKKLKVNNENFDDEFDISQFYNLIIRNKKIFSLITIIGFLFGTIIGLSERKTWEGEFQIVVQKNNNNREISNLIESDSLNSIFSNSNISKGKNIKTEVEILQSRSLLMPIYNFQREEAKKYNYKLLKYSQWKKNIKIKLIKSTSVLDVTYKDKNKDLILPTLEKLSENYQKYSDLERKNNIEKTIIYLNNQIRKYKKQSKISDRKFKEFAIKENLNPLDSDLMSLTSSTGSESKNNFSISSLSGITFNSKTKLKTVNEILNTLENDPINEELFAYIGRTIPEIDLKDTFNLIDKMNEEINQAKLIYQKNDRFLIQLEKEKKNLLDLMQFNTMNALKSLQISLKAKQTSTEKPKEVVFRYSELLAQAIKDKATLNSLDLQLRSFKLKEAKSAEPWQLITNPSLSDEYLSPSKKRVLFLSLSISALISILVIIFYEKKTGIVYSKKELQKIIKSPLLVEFDSDSHKEKMVALATKLNNETLSKNIYLYCTDKEKNKDLENIFVNLNQNLKQKSLIITNETLSKEENQELILCIIENSESKKIILNIIEMIYLQNQKMIGWVYLKENLI